MTVATLVDLESLRARLPELAPSYQSAQPFPHVVVDDVLHPEAFARAVEEFPAIRDPFWKGYLHVNETKYGNTQPDTWGTTLNAIAKEFCSPEFVSFLEELTGIENLLPDWSMDGGGLHQTLRGGHLNIHADFTTHHEKLNWSRRVNILLYLNEEWPEEWGGQLELWDQKMTAAQAKVQPAGNRMLIFTTSDDSFHGHPDALTCPDGVARRSMALYYFTEEAAPVRKATNYRARPEESGLKKAAIAVDRNVLDVYDRTLRKVGLDADKVSGVLEKVNKFRRPKK
ncbi:2OG-Fe(II) oxygenase [Knoellia subterranea]|uniref:Proline hydroxylase n=1 Tax=Knoellia subterranea KCTC 19937 TaxID=1385521 RepID=A0A0A0JT30_9MICO|nr:2OG-Fe(II) oxygenase [Knoellia subterranea]KGN38806.1 proline hydroxylase [Knoellia subterranea KCTC 19937]